MEENESGVNNAIASSPRLIPRAPKETHLVPGVNAVCKLQYAMNDANLFLYFAPCVDQQVDAIVGSGQHTESSKVSIVRLKCRQNWKLKKQQYQFMFDE